MLSPAQAFHKIAHRDQRGHLGEAASKLSWSYARELMEISPGWDAWELMEISPGWDAKNLMEIEGWDGACFPLESGYCTKIVFIKHDSIAL